MSCNFCDNDQLVPAEVRSILTNSARKVVETSCGNYEVEPSTPAQMGRVQLRLRPPTDGGTGWQLISALPAS